MLLDLGFNCQIQLDQWLTRPQVIEPPQINIHPGQSDLTLSNWMSEWVSCVPKNLNFYLQLPRGLGYLGFLAAGSIHQPTAVNYAGFFDPANAHIVKESDWVTASANQELLVNYELPFWVMDQQNQLWKLQYFNNPLTIDPLKEWYLYQKKKSVFENLDPSIINSELIVSATFFNAISASILSFVGSGIESKLFNGFQFWDAITHEMLIDINYDRFISNLLISNPGYDCYPLGYIIKRPGVYYRSHCWKF